MNARCFRAQKQLQVLRRTSMNGDIGEELKQDCVGCALHEFLNNKMPISSVIVSRTHVMSPMPKFSLDHCKFREVPGSLSGRFSMHCTTHVVLISLGSVA